MSFARAPNLGGFPLRLAIGATVGVAAAAALPFVRDMAGVY